MLSAYLVIGVSWRVMACFCVRVEFMPSIISSRLTASCVALSIVFGLLCKKDRQEEEEGGKGKKTCWGGDRGRIPNRQVCSRKQL